MSTQAKQETLGFQTEVKQLLHLMVHSLYSNKEIFLRELISNASDAADKLRFEALKDDSLYEGDAELKIRVEFNPRQKTITVIDNGIGMSRDEVIEHLGTIAKSGTKQFFESLTGDASKDSQLIGQFGVGFYSSFIVAKKVEVVSRRAGLGRAEGVRWISEGENDYSIETFDRPKRGTKVTLHLRDDMDEFLNNYRLRGIITKYSDHISLPIVMDKEEEAEDKESKDGKEGKTIIAGEETVNSKTALWRRDKKAITEKEYHEFYKHIGHDFEDPLKYIHNRVEGKIEYTSLLYIPARAPFDLWDRQQQHGVKLYVKRVFIMDNAEQLLPPWLRFIRGVIDSDDLPLNVSRELLQKNKMIDSIRSGCVKKILSTLKTMAKKETENYAKFWDTFGKVLKEGVVDSADYKSDLAELFRFASTHDDTEKQQVTLADYVSRMKADQAAIYYVAAESYAKAKSSPHLEFFRKNDIEVLLLSDPIDEWVTTHLDKYSDKPFQSINKGDLDLSKLAKDGDKKAKQASAEDEDLAKRIAELLGEKVKSVRVSNRLTSSPACLVTDENDMTRHMAQILKASGQSVPATKPILEINPEHVLVKQLGKEKDKDKSADWSHILFDQAVLSEGGQLDDPASFVNRLNNVFALLEQ